LEYILNKRILKFQGLTRLRSQTTATRLINYILVRIKYWTCTDFLVRAWGVLDYLVGYDALYDVLTYGTCTDFSGQARGILGYLG
jgi:hypothetical protein